MLSRRTMRGPSARLFQMPVCTVRPCQSTSLGRPTLTDNRLAMGAAPSSDRVSVPPGGPVWQGPPIAWLCSTAARPNTDSVLGRPVGRVLRLGPAMPNDSPPPAGRGVREPGRPCRNALPIQDQSLRFGPATFDALQVNV